MGRKRKSNKHLPERVIYREVNKTFYFLKPVDGKNKWINLGKDFTSAMMEWAKLVEIDKSPVNM